MAELRPYPFRALLRRAFRELDGEGKIFDLPLASCFGGFDDLDLSVAFHGRRAGTPLGPAAGPQSQMAQNIALSWLAGCRIMELKTVQVRDDLEIPRPCIDMATIGYNVEWSQELKLEESLEEYVKGMMLVEILRASGRIPQFASASRVIYDISVGYDLAGIQSERVQAFIGGMQDATPLIDRLRRDIPDELKKFRDLDFPSRISETVTLSTFHGCPPDEIERIVDYLLRHNRLSSIVKLNPMLLGPERARELLGDVMGYADVHIPDSAFERDTRWDQMAEFVERLGETAREEQLGFGVKFSNTLIVENRREFFPATEKEMYVSGPPLYVPGDGPRAQLPRAIRESFPCLVLGRHRPRQLRRRRRARPGSGDRVQRPVEAPRVRASEGLLRCAEVPHAGGEGAKHPGLRDPRLRPGS